MTHLSPAVFGMWSVCSALLTAFCFYHVWHYDRFKCLRMNHGPYSGAFQRLMTYTYILTLPLITIYSLGNAVIKYQEGFVINEHSWVSPKPHNEWTKAHQDAIFPLLIVYSVAFSLEMTTHLEEFCFWVFLMNATSSSRDWFRSSYFIVWSCGSAVALIYVPTIAVIFRHDPLVDEAYTILAASLGSLTLTLIFVPILYSFPGFLRSLVQQGVDGATILRLVKFHELNRLRILFRLLFVVPLLILGIDGSKPHDHTINESMVITDILGMISAFGCLVSSAITLLIFFPRNAQTEYDSSSLGRLRDLEVSRRKVKHHHHEKAPEHHSELASGVSTGSFVGANHPLSFAVRSESEDRHGASPKDQTHRVRKIEDNSGDATLRVDTSLPSVASVTSSAPLRPNRLGPNGDIELGGAVNPPGTGEWVNNWTSRYRSPLDVMQ